MTAYKYLASLFYDCIVVFILFFVYTAILLVFTHGKAIPEHTLWYQCSLIALSALYYHVSVCFGGQTIGMKAWGLYLVTTYDKKSSATQILARYLLFLPACLGSPFFLQWNTTLLEKWTRTRLVNQRVKNF